MSDGTFVCRQAPVFLQPEPPTVTGGRTVVARKQKVHRKPSKKNMKGFIMYAAVGDVNGAEPLASVDIRRILRFERGTSQLGLDGVQL